MQTDPLGDFLTQIRNANTASLPEILAPYSKLKSEVGHVLKREGFIEDVEITKNKEFQALRLKLKTKGRAKAIRGLRRISRPGLRRYVAAGDIPRVLGGLGVAVLSTSRGILTGLEAKKQNVGGEVLLYVW
jgi:small subunit ribosomal protein S8